MPVDNSRLEGFYKLSVSERRMKLAEIANLDDEHVQAWAASGELSEDAADRMIENVIGTYTLPIGVATNFIIDGDHYLIPFVLEEPSVVAAASNMAKRCIANGGFRSNNDEPVMIGQIQIVNCENPDIAKGNILSLISLASSKLLFLIALNSLTCNGAITLPAPDNNPFAPITREDINHAL